MKEFLIVLNFELMNYLKKKAFVISTILLCVILVVVLIFPNIMDMFSSSSGEDEGTETTSYNFGLVDDENLFNENIRDSFLGEGITIYDSIDTLEADVDSGDITAGFIVNSLLEYEYIIKNNEMFDSNSFIFEEALQANYRIIESANRGLDYEQFSDLIEPQIQSETRILGTDSASNYMYTYLLVFGLYFIIIIYGQIVASSVAAEKGNRTMELLVTSTNTTYLIFGKVISGALAGIIQFGLILGTGLITYKLNAEAWDYNLDFLFDIPTNVLIAFTFFGVMGYLFYAFIFGALGALVSRTEDVSTSSTPITILFVGVFMVAVIGMQNTSGMVLKVASFLPFSSFMAMFVRIAMGTVSILEIMASFLILIVSTVIIGVLASRIYRAGTLMYGNRIKLKDAFKLLKNS